VAAAAATGVEAGAVAAVTPAQDVAAPAAGVAEAEPAPRSAGENAAVIAELRARLVQQEEAKRYHEYVKTLLALGDELADPAEKSSCYAQAAEVYLSKFSNQAEAVKAYEKVVELDPTHPVAADYLRQMYEKRRDWEKLIALAQREAALMPPGPERAAKFKEIAALATERVRKPEICTELWAGVLAEEPDDVDALGALSQLYERSREYDKLADVLERLVEFTYDSNEKIQLLTKLGQIVGDRLNDDARAVEAYRQLLTLSRTIGGPRSSSRSGTSPWTLGRSRALLR
jgi:tetratricopeptide (TPR) repeat protein